MENGSKNPIVPRKSVDWAPVREAFVQRPQRATYDELSVEFAIAAPTIARTSADEGWPALRNAWLESQVKAADGASIILAAVKGDRAVSQAYLSIAIVTLATLQALVESVRDSDKAESTKAECINTCMFAAKNLADSLKSVGIVGIARAINAAGDAGNGRWNPEMLQQINVTVQNLQAQAQPKGPGDFPPAAQCVTLPVDPPIVPKGANQAP